MPLNTNYILYQNSFVHVQFSSVRVLYLFTQHLFSKISSIRTVPNSLSPRDSFEKHFCFKRYKLYEFMMY